MEEDNYGNLKWSLTPGLNPELILRKDLFFQCHPDFNSLKAHLLVPTNRTHEHISACEIYVGRKLWEVVFHMGVTSAFFNRCLAIPNLTLDDLEKLSINGELYHFRSFASALESYEGNLLLQGPLLGHSTILKTLLRSPAIISELWFTTSKMMDNLRLARISEYLRFSSKVSLNNANSSWRLLGDQKLVGTQFGGEESMVNLNFLPFGEIVGKIRTNNFPELIHIPTNRTELHPVEKWLFSRMEKHAQNAAMHKIGVFRNNLFLAKHEVLCRVIFGLILFG